MGLTASCAQIPHNWQGIGIKPLSGRINRNEPFGRGVQTGQSARGVAVGVAMIEAGFMAPFAVSIAYHSGIGDLRVRQRTLAAHRQPCVQRLQARDKGFDLVDRCALGQAQAQGPRQRASAIVSVAAFLGRACIFQCVK